MAATRRSTSKKGGSSGDSAAGTTRQAATRPSSRPRTASDPQSPTDAPKRGRTAPRVKGRTPEQIEAARLARNKRERERRARIRAAEQAASSADEKPKAKPKGNATGKGSRRSKKPVRFRPAAPEDFAAVREAMATSAEVVKREAKLTPLERVERDEAVVSALAMGLTVRTVAKEVGLSPDQVEQIRDAARDRYVQAAPRGEAVLWDALRGLDQNIEVAQRLVQPVADGEAKANPLALGALRLKHDLQTARLELMLAMGLISASPATYERERQARDYLLRFLDELRDAGVDPQLIEQVATRAMPVDVAGDTVAAARHAATEDRSIAAG